MQSKPRSGFFTCSAAVAHVEAGKIALRARARNPIRGSVNSGAGAAKEPAFESAPSWVALANRPHRHGHEAMLPEHGCGRWRGLRRRCSPGVAQCVGKQSSAASNRSSDQRSRCPMLGRRGGFQPPARRAVARCATCAEGLQHLHAAPRRDAASLATITEWGRREVQPAVAPLQAALVRVGGSLASRSRRMVTGPSLVSVTCMFAPNWPVCTCGQRSRRTATYRS